MADGLPPIESPQVLEARGLAAGERLQIGGRKDVHHLVGMRDSEWLEDEPRSHERLSWGPCHEPRVACSRLQHRARALVDRYRGPVTKNVRLWTATVWGLGRCEYDH